MTVRFKISQVDRHIDENRHQLQRAEKISPFSAASWQKAWDKHPDLYARESAMFKQRGELQDLRDRVDARAQRRTRAAKTKFEACPTCGHHTVLKVAA